MAITIDHIGAKAGRLWRPLVAMVAVYALALQAFAFGLAGSGIAGTAGDNPDAAFEICLHDADSAPATPAQNPADHVHCIFCIVGGHLAFVTPTASPHPMAIATGGVLLPPAGDWRCPALTHRHSAQPRGPPLTA